MKYVEKWVLPKILTIFNYRKQYMMSESQYCRNDRVIHLAHAQKLRKMLKIEKMAKTGLVFEWAWIFQCQNIKGVSCHGIHSLDLELTLFDQNIGDFLFFKISKKLTFCDFGVKYLKIYPLSYLEFLYSYSEFI